MGLLDDVRDELVHRHRTKVAAETKAAADKAAATLAAEREALTVEAAATKRQIAALAPQLKAAEGRAHKEAIEERMRVIAADRRARNKRDLSSHDLRVRAIRSLAR